MTGLGLRGVAFITGAGGALGRAMALQFARDGVRRIAGVDLSPQGLSDTAQALRTADPAVDFLPLAADISNEEQVATAFRSVIHRFGRVDYAVNNAAIAGPLGPTDTLAVDDLDRVQKINLRGTWLCEREELKHMATQEPLQTEGDRVPSRGSIVVVSSLLGIRAMPQNSLYTISKHAILGLVRTDALDYAAKGIRINAVCPG
ncbi:hypothetical protein A1O3_02017 [Capronia epimyces CBS 606.96]|uniref:Glucose 1-dehydrogenase n=1 Tax=Capronia epimyces CBS 606.96 TaxID=1182542 RepID=W9Y8V9_9EURO|nr:uncharacterized protein A1O3_02017 [Capronia epimyces CBS 606.96]EXJ88953.1 hypothetical protein A1O3_02017 [Capronia epimyces CBS 606.96]